MQPCSQLTIDCKLILQFRLNEFQFRACIIDPKGNTASFPLQDPRFPNYHVYQLVSACDGRGFPWADL